MSSTGFLEVSFEHLAPLFTFLMDFILCQWQYMDHHLQYERWAACHGLLSPFRNSNIEGDVEELVRMCSGSVISLACNLHNHSSKHKKSGLLILCHVFPGFITRKHLLYLHGWIGCSLKFLCKFCILMKITFFISLSRL